MKKLAILVFFIGLVSNALAQKEIFSTADGAIQGYDPVAYFKDSKPVMGKKEFSYAWKGATWQFSSSQNMKDFIGDPEKYAPQYGGYCAYGTADGHKAPTSADAWTIENGKLYLNYNKDVQKIWTKDKTTFIPQADKNWPDVKKQKD